MHYFSWTMPVFVHSEQTTNWRNSSACAIIEKPPGTKGGAFPVEAFLTLIWESLLAPTIVAIVAIWFKWWLSKK